MDEEHAFPQLVGCTSGGCLPAEDRPLMGWSAHRAPELLGRLRLDSVALDVARTSAPMALVPKSIARFSKSPKELTPLRTGKPRDWRQVVTSRVTNRVTGRLSWAYWRAKRRQGRKYSQVVLLAFLSCLVVWHGLLAPTLWDMPEAAERRLVEPRDNITDNGNRKGFVLLHCVGLFYMFVGIAIVCDECFVPALEVISEVLNLSPDVAGATFMAAGGSAPEFFTSLIGTCVGAQSDIGTGTIIGSAVFNVLFVIGACAIAAPEPLKLTWFPLARDASFYAVDLVCVTVVFLDEQVKWSEAMGLFILYIMYATFMVYSERIEAWSRGKSGSELCDEQEEAAEESQQDGGWGEQDSAQRAQQAPVKLGHPTSNASASVQSDPKASMIRQVSPNFAMSQSQPSRDAGTGEASDKDHPIREVRIYSSEGDKPGKASILNRSGSRAEDKRQSAGKDHQSFRHKSMRVQTHIHHVVHLRRSESKAALDEKGEGDDEHDHEDEPNDSTGGSGMGNAPQPRVEDDAIPVPAGLPTSCHTPGAPPHLPPSLVEFSDVVPVQDPHLHLPGNSSSMPNLKHHHPSNCASSGESCHAEPAASEEEGGGSSSYNSGREVEEEEEEENEPLSIMPPDSEASKKDWIWYFATFPIVLCLVCTIPDVRREGWRNYFILSFMMSIVWIAIFTWIMVWFAIAISEIFGLEKHIMGLTVLAAGTSVPDLLTSMIVAREGHGDMAVSSSIGSNIFDVTVGLPVPWMIYSALNSGKSVLIKNEALEICVLLLLAMLAFTIGTIMCHDWVMTRGMGASLLVLYFCFEVIAVSITFAPEGSLKLIKA